MATKVEDLSSTELTYVLGHDASDLVGKFPTDAFIYPITYFGASTSHSDDSTYFQDAFDASSNEGKIIFIPPGNWYADDLTIRDGLHVIGRKNHLYNGTSLNYGSVIKPPSGSTNASVMKLEEGPNINIYMADFELYGNGNADQMGLYFYGYNSVSPNNGGLWHSMFERITIDGFDGHAMWWRGETTSNYLLPNQFLTFTNCKFYRYSDTSRAALITGQTGQILFLNTIFDGPLGSMNTVGTKNIEISREWFDGVSTYGGRTVGGSAVGATAPGDIKIISGSIQNAEQLVYIDASSNIKFDTWFENAKYGVYAVSSGKIVVDGYMGNVGSNGASGGYTFHLDGSDGSYFATTGGTYDKSVKLSNGGACYPNEGRYSSTPTDKVDNERQISVNGSGVVDAGRNRYLAVNTTATNFATFTSTLGPGAIVYIRALNGTVPLVNSGNLYLPGGAASYTLAQNEIAMLLKTDLGTDTWRVISVSAAT